jgi:hypothetical protein
MDFKLKETGMIWESYMTRFGSQSEEDDGDNNIMDDIMGDNYDDDDDHKSVVMSFDTSEPVEADHDHDDHDDHSTTERDDMIRSELAKLVEFASRLHKMSDDGEFEEWMAAKITKAADYTSDVYFRLSTKADYANCGCDSEI